MYRIRKYIIAVIATAAAQAAASQVTDMGAMPFLGMETDARSAGMAGAGVALIDNPLAVYTNAASSLSGEGRFGAGIFAGPWNTGEGAANVLYGAGGFYKWNDRNSVLAGFRYMPGSAIDMMDDDGFPAGTARSKDMSVDFGYGRRLGKNFALSLTARWMMSDPGYGNDKANSFAFDLGGAYSRKLSWLEGASWSAGFRLADIGPKVEIDGKKYSLPGRAEIGGSLALPFTANHMLVCALDIDYQFQPTGIFGASLGAEYTFLGHGVVRAGYHGGPSSKGSGSYATVGCGFIAGPVRFDAAFRTAGDKYNPHNNTFIFSLGFIL